MANLILKRYSYPLITSLLKPFFFQILKLKYFANCHYATMDIRLEGKYLMRLMHLLSNLLSGKD